MYSGGQTLSHQAAGSYSVSPQVQNLCPAGRGRQLPPLVALVLYHLLAFLNPAQALINCSH